MILLIGAAGSGKSTIEKILKEEFGLKRITSYTTRAIRENETNHIDYHFISQEEFDQKLSEGFFAENTVYNSWSYGIAKEDCNDDSLAVVEFSGARQLKNNPDLNIVSFFIKVDERTRVIRLMQRGDNIMESFRRVISDQGGFSGIEREVDYVVENPDGDPHIVAEQIYNILKEA